jgi:hypothetical protein
MEITKGKGSRLKESLSGMSLRAASRTVSGTWGNFLIGGSFERKFIIPSGLIPNF